MTIKIGNNVTVMIVEFEYENIVRVMLFVRDICVGHFCHSLERGHSSHCHVIVTAFLQGSVIEVAAVGATVADNKITVRVEPIRS